MKITIDENKIITGYTTVGDIEGSIEYNDKLPDGFKTNFKPYFYLLKNDEIVENPDYVEPEPPVVGPSVIEQQLAALGYQQMQDTQDKQALIKQNAEMAYQIMKIQQQLGGQKA